MKRLAAVIFFLFVPAAMGWAAPPALIPLTALPEFGITPGAAIYRRYCLFCHGEQGRGDGLNAYTLATRPADLPAQAQGAAPRSLAARRRAIIRDGGRAHGLAAAMPAFGATLTPLQIDRVLDFIQGLRVAPPAATTDDNDDDL